MMILAASFSFFRPQSLVLRHAPPRACAVDSVTIASVRRALAESEARVADAAALIDLPRMREAVEELEARSSAPGFWDDADQAEETLRVLNDRRASLEQAAGWAVALEDARAAIELAEAEADADAEDSLLPEALAALEALGSARGSGARCSTASTTRAAPSSPSSPARAASTRRTGRRCCCGCTRGGPSGSRGRARR